MAAQDPERTTPEEDAAVLRLPAALLNRPDRPTIADFLAQDVAPTHLGEAQAPHLPLRRRG